MPRYPLAFVGCRDGILDLLNVPVKNRTPSGLNSLTIVLLSLLTMLAYRLKDVSFVLALAGATLGNALTYVYPALMYRAIVKKQRRRKEGFGVFMATMSALLGIAMGAIGTKYVIEA